MTTGAALGWYGTYVPTVFLFVSDSYHVEGVVSHCMYILVFNRHFFSDGGGDELLESCVVLVPL